MGKILLTQEEIQKIAKKIGAQMSEDLANEELAPVFVCVMKGAILWMADIIKNVTVPFRIDYMDISSYSGDKSSGEILLRHEPESPVEGRTVVIVEDIVDTGLSMKFLLEYFKKKNPKRVLVCTLLEKKAFREHDVQIDYVGKVLQGPEFVVGYGFDFDGLERNVPYIYLADEEDVERLKLESKR